MRLAAVILAAVLLGIGGALYGIGSEEGVVPQAKSTLYTLGAMCAIPGGLILLVSGKKATAAAGGLGLLALAGLGFVIFLLVAFLSKG